MPRRVIILPMRFCEVDGMDDIMEFVGYYPRLTIRREDADEEIG